MWPEPTEATLFELLNSSLIGKIITIYANYPLRIKTEGLISIVTYRQNSYNSNLTLILEDCQTHLDNHETKNKININFDAFEIEINKINKKVTQELILSPLLPKWVPWKFQQLMWQKKYRGDRFTCSQYTFKKLAIINNDIN